MKTTNLLLLFSLLLFNSYASSQDMKEEGILAAYNVEDNQFYLENKIEIINDDNSVYATIFRDNQDEIVFSGVDTLNIFAYYPDYNIIIFSAKKKSNTEYYVNVNGLRKRIIDHNLKFLKWDEFILKVSLVFSDNYPVYTEKKEDKSKLLQNQLDYNSFNVLGVEGNWLKIKCDNECEGCNDLDKNKIFWIKWKDESGKILIIDFIRYIC